MLLQTFFSKWMFTLLGTEMPWLTIMFLTRRFYHFCLNTMATCHEDLNLPSSTNCFCGLNKLQLVVYTMTIKNISKEQLTKNDVHQIFPLYLSTDSNCVQIYWLFHAFSSMKYSDRPHGIGGHLHITFLFCYQGIGRGFSDILFYQNCAISSWNFQDTNVLHMKYNGHRVISGVQKNRDKKQK